MSSKSVFLIGPGYIGQEIIGHLLNDKYNVTTLIRRPSAAAQFAKIGVKTVLGSLNDKEIIKRQVVMSDIVFHTATADHLPSVEAVIAGLEERAAQGKQTIYIHTSGASTFADDSAGERLNDEVYDDEKRETIDALPDTAHHRVVDLAVLRGTKALGDKVKLAIMIPPAIYGVGSNSDRLSIQYPTMVRYALKHGYAGQVGKGLSKWSQVHVKDLGRGYMTILRWLQAVTPEEAAFNPYWFCENGEELSWGDVAAEIGRALFAAGRLPNSEVQVIPRGRYGDMFGAEGTEVVAGSNARVRARRLRGLGWEAREKGTLESLREDEIPILLEEEGEFNGYEVKGVHAAHG